MLKTSILIIISTSARGFGAKLGDEVCHAFALSDGQAHGIDGVLESYRSCFKTGFIMSGPTDITQVSL